MFIQSPYVSPGLSVIGLAIVIESVTGIMPLPGSTRAGESAAVGILQETTMHWLYGTGVICCIYIFFFFKS